MHDGERLERIEERLTRIMSAQDDIDAAVTAINGFLTDLSADVQKITALLEAGGGTPADTSALNTAVAELPAAQAAVDALANPPAAPAEPAQP